MKQSYSDYGISLPPGAPGPEVSTQCPECSDQRRKKNLKCLSVNVEKETWNCHHCGWAGGLKEAKEYHRPTQAKQYKKPEAKAPGGISQAALAWFKNRAISEVALMRNAIESGRVFFPQLETTAEAVIFPYFKNGQLVNRKYRTISGKDFRMESGCELVLYGFDDIDPEQDLIWCEGEADKLALESAGFFNVVSVPNGAPPPNANNYESQLSYLDSAMEKISAVKRHVIAVDNDGPGAFLEVELARRIGTEKCWRTRWPEGCKDANDVLMKHGAEELRWYIENAEAFPIDGAFGAPMNKDDLRRQFLRGFERGARTGWRSLDQYYTVRPGEVTVVTGIPSSGKSNFIDCLMVNLAKLHEWRFAIFSPENLPLTQHQAAIMEKIVGRPFDEGGKNRMTMIELDAAIEWSDQRFTWVLPGHQRDWTLDKILSVASQLCLRYGIRGLVIDPWNELEPMRPSGMNETEYISRSLSAIHEFARSRAVHVWIVVHPAKLSRDKEGNYPVPTLYDCHGSVHWRNKADNGICVWRDLAADDTPEVEIHIQKIRFRHIGRRGMVTLVYEPECATYRDQTSLKTVSNN